MISGPRIKAECPDGPSAPRGIGWSHSVYLPCAWGDLEGPKRLRSHVGPSSCTLGTFYRDIPSDYQTANAVAQERTEPQPQLSVGQSREPAQVQGEGACTSLLAGRSVRTFLASFYFFHSLDHSLTRLFSAFCHFLPGMLSHHRARSFVFAVPGV